jgi:hypothetical protein
MDPESFARIPNIIITKKEFVYNIHIDEFLHHSSAWLWYQSHAGPCQAAPAVYIIGDLLDTRNRFSRLLVLGRMDFASPSGKRYIIADTPIYSRATSRSISRHAPIASMRQNHWRSCGVLGADLESAIWEAASTDGYERPQLSVLTNYIQRPMNPNTSRSLKSQTKGAHRRGVRSNDVAGYSRAYQRALAALIPNRGSPCQDHSGVRGSRQYSCPTQSTGSVVHRLASAPATLSPTQLRDISKLDTNNSNSFFQSGGSAVTSKESDALGKLFENYRGLRNQGITAEAQLT